MKLKTLDAQVAAFADDFELPFSQLFNLIMSKPQKWVCQLEGWFVLCRTAPHEAFAEETLAEILETLVSLMHARMTFSGIAIPQYGQHPKIMVSGDLGGAMLAGAARGRIIRLALDHDRDMACRLATVVLHQIEAQRRTIADLMAKAI